MARALSNTQYASFLQDVQPDSLNLPQWGGIAQWSGLYVLMYKMTSGEWALSDITSGIPYGGTVVPVADYVKQLPSYQPSWTETFIYAIPVNFMAAAAEYAADAGALATQTAQVGGDTIRAALQPLIQSIVLPLAPMIVAALILFGVLYAPKPRT